MNQFEAIESVRLRAKRAKRKKEKGKKIDPGRARLGKKMDQLVVYTSLPGIKEDNNPPEDNLKEDIPIRKVRRTITINGVDITEYQKKLEALNNTTQNNRKKNQQKKETKTRKKQENNTTLQKITTFFNKQ